MMEPAWGAFYSFPRGLHMKAHVRLVGRQVIHDSHQKDPLCDA